MKTILVTGGAGYIGSHTCKALAEAGYIPVTFDNLSRGHAWAVKWGPLEIGDLTDPTRLQDVFRAYKPAAIMHFAGYSYVGESVSSPSDYYFNNVVGSWHLLEAMRRNQIHNIVFSSSCSVYGDGHCSPIPECTAFSPVSPYGATKALVERMLIDYKSAYGFLPIALRYFNAAGADGDAEIGEAHNPETHLIPLILATASGTNRTLRIYGDDYPTTDGTCIRDYIHVTDLASAHVAALERNLSDGLHGSYNLGTGTGYSVRQIIDAAQQVTGRNIPHEIGPRRFGDPPFAVANPTKAISELGLTFRYSDLKSIVSSAWQWTLKYQAI